MRVVNVIQVNTVYNITVESFISNGSVNEQQIVDKAEARFIELISEQGANEDDINSFLDDGIYQANADLTIYLVWSD